MRLRNFALAGAWLAASTLGQAALAAVEPQDPYAALLPLIGEWDVGPPESAPAFVERFSWGPNRAYIWMSVALFVPSGKEHLHFEGMIVWNGSTQRFDYLFVVEPGSLTQEQGEFHVAGNGEIVREVVLTRPDGSTGIFRQTFRAIADGLFETTLMGETPDGWKPTFPGSERLTMRPRKTAS
jgi:hypothetical protein